MLWDGLFGTGQIYNFVSSTSVQEESRCVLELRRGATVLVAYGRVLVEAYVLGLGRVEGIHVGRY